VVLLRTGLVRLAERRVLRHLGGIPLVVAVTRTGGIPKISFCIAGLAIRVQRAPDETVEIQRVASQT
jgi:hypothetical protein